MRTEQFPEWRSKLRYARHLDVRDGVVGEADHCLNVIFVGDIVPHKIRLIKTGDVNHPLVNDVEQPIEIVGAPIVKRAAGDCFDAAPQIGIGFSLTTRPHFDTEHPTDDTALDQSTQCPKIRIPTAVVVDR